MALLGIDVGGTKVAVAVGDADGHLHATARRATEPGPTPTEDLDRIAADARAVVGDAGLSLADIDAVGVSVPGPLDAQAGVVIRPPNLPTWDRAPVRAHLAEALGRPVYIDNDANAAALAEWHFGSGQGFEHLVYLTMSTGVGGGLILGGRLHRGVMSHAGEVGHVAVEWGGEACSCGLRGCLEAYVGGAAWTKRLRKSAPESSRAVALAGGRDRLRPEEIVEAARAGDEFALSEMARFNHYLARGIAAVVFTVAPQAVVLGTIATAAGDALCLDPVREQVREQVWPMLGRDLKILPAALGETLPYHAGIAVALAGLREEPR